MNKPTPFKGLNIKIPNIIPIKGRGFINHGFTLVGQALKACVEASEDLALLGSDFMDPEIWLQVTGPP